MIVEVHNLYKKYKEATHFALNNINFSVQKGEIYGILGTNGAGKTTLMSILFGGLLPTMGNFSIAGLSYAHKARNIRFLIGIVPQEYALYPTLTARENLNYFGSLYGLKKSFLQKRIDEILDRVGLLSVANTKIQYFSGGMKRRANLAAGILHTPELLFLDEPTVGVDVSSKNIIIQYLKELNQQGMSIIYTSHHLLEAQDFCHRVAILNKGSILTEDTPEKLIASVQNAQQLEDVFIRLTSESE